MWQRILSEPTMLVEIVRQLMLGLALFGVVAFTPEQDRWLMSFASLLLAWLNRSLVTPRGQDDRRG